MPRWCAEHCAWCRSSAATDDARVIGHALERHAIGALDGQSLVGAEIFFDDGRHRRAVLRIDGGPAGDAVGLAGLDRRAVVEKYLGANKTLTIKRANRVTLKGVANNPGIIGGG